MDTPRSRSRRNKRKASRQASQERLKSASRPETPKQPEAGPSRLPDQPDAMPPTTKSSQHFSSEVDFIALELEEEVQPKRTARERDKGKSERDWNRDRDRDDWSRGRKRKWEDSDRDDRPSSRRAEVKRPILKSRRSPWTVDVDWESCRNVAQLLHNEVEAYIKYISPTPIEHEVRHMTVLLVAGSVKKTYSDSEVLPFGSFGTKLYLPQGDIDLVVKSRTLGSFDKVSALRSLANIVRRTGITDQVTVISKAKVPIIKFVTKYGRLSVDISINQANGVQAGDMINRFIREFPALRALVLIVKAFLKQRNLNEVYSGGLGSYAIVCLAVSHLQMHPKVRRGEIDSANNLGVLMLEFFELYGKCFNYTNTGISLRHGGSYFSKQARGWKDYNKPYLLSIEDPGDISNDISRGSYGIKKVKQTFAGAYELMVSALYIVADILSARQDSRAVDLRRGSDLERSPDEMSILSSILGTDQETINHRRLIQKVYEEGKLHRLLGIDPLVELGVSSEAVEEKRNRAVESVVEAWGEVDMVIGSEDEDYEVTNGQNGRERGANDEGNDADQSRYGISAHQNGSALKRRRTMTTKAINSASVDTVFVADDEDEEDLDNTDAHSEQINLYPDVDAVTSNSSDGLDEIERVYAVAADELAESEDQGGDEYQGSVDYVEDEDEDSAYLKGTKRRGKGKGRLKVITAEMRQAFWAAKSARGGDSESS